METTLLVPPLPPRWYPSPDGATTWPYLICMVDPLVPVVILADTVQAATSARAQAEIEPGSLLLRRQRWRQREPGSLLLRVRGEPGTGKSEKTSRLPPVLMAATCKPTLQLGTSVGTPSAISDLYTDWIDGFRDRYRCRDDVIIPRP